MKDQIIRGLIAGKTVKLMAISGGELTEKARRVHGLSRVCTAALGRTLMITCMMGAQMKDEGKLTTIVKGGGIAGNIVCTAFGSGRVKGYIENPSIELPLNRIGKLDVAGAVGSAGELTVIRDMGLKEPYIGRCQIVSGEIAYDFARYFTISEQKPTLLYLGVHVAPDTGVVLAAGGILIQPMPGCPDSIIDELTARTDDIGRLAALLEKGMTLDEAVASVLPGEELEDREELIPRFECDCSRERLERVLISLGREELTDMLEKEGMAELTCQFCNRSYRFSGDDLTRLLEESAPGGDT